MFCSQCGAKADGRFCWKCGAPLQGGGESGEVAGPVEPAAPGALAVPAEPAAPADWSHETQYKTLMAVPEVRDRIARAASQARKGMSAEDFLSMGDKLLGSMAGAPIPISTVVELVQPVYTRLGLKHDKQRSGRLELPAGRATVGVLCSLALHSMTISAVHQAADGCVIEAEVPSSMFVFSSGLVATVTALTDGGTQLEAAVTARGQLYDWGRGKAALDTLFADVARYAAPDLVG
jgi:hypothetical protein